MEKWKIINNFSNYEISTEGRVRNLKTQYILKGRESKSGYLQVFIKNDIDGDFKNQYIHRLVAIHFIENPNNITNIIGINLATVTIKLRIAPSLTPATKMK